MVIFSDLTNTYDDVSGAAVGYVWIRKNPLRIAGEINDGIGYMTVVGELEGVPEQYQDAYNIRLTIPIEIRKEFVNRSPILFKNLDNLQNILDNNPDVCLQLYKKFQIFLCR